MFAEKLTKAIALNTKEGNKEYENAYDFMCDNHIEDSLSCTVKMGEDETHCFKSITDFRQYISLLISAKNACEAVPAGLSC